MYLVLLRHGESEWNRENRFTGWADVELSEKGIEEAKRAGRLLRAGGFAFDIAFSSVLRRANRTLELALTELGLSHIPTRTSWRLNERHYGALQGLNKAETAAQHGEEKIRIWRRSFDVRPPELELSDPRHARHDPKYGGLADHEIPHAESLADTIERFLPFWYGDIFPALQDNQRVVIAAHGNSLRGLVKNLEGLSAEEILNVEIPTGTPLVYELDGNLKPVRRFYLE